MLGENFKTFIILFVWLRWQRTWYPEGPEIERNQAAREASQRGS